MRLVKIDLSIILIFVLGFLLRVFYLHLFPVAISNDEHEYIMNSKSIFYTGRSLPNTSLGIFSSGNTSSDMKLAELPSYIFSPLIGPTELNQYFVRIPYAMVSSLSILLIYILIQNLLHRRRLSLLSSFVMAINPWSIHFGRIGLEITLVTFFYLLGLILILNKSKIRIISILFFILGFLSYHGAKLVFIPMIFYILIWKIIFHGKKYLYSSIIIASIAMFSVVVYFIFFVYQGTNTRTKELVFFNTDRTTRQVDDDRRLSIQSPVQKLFSNKITYYLTNIADNYINAFNTKLLFTNGENNAVLSLLIHGMFYWIELPLLILGIIGLYILNKKIWLLILGLIAIAPLSSSLSTIGQSYVQRAGLMFPLLGTLIAIGIYTLSRKFRGQKILFTIFITVLYVFSLSNFLNIYFIRYPIFNSEGFSLSHKVLAKYLQLAIIKNPDIKIYVTAKDPLMLFLKFLYYNNIYNDFDNIKAINQNISEKKYYFGNSTFTYDCLDNTSDINTDIIWIEENAKECPSPVIKTPRILTLTDSGSLFSIHNDFVCEKYNLPQYLKISNTSELDISSMNEEEFCHNWIAYY